MNDIEKIEKFMDSIHSDVAHEGETVTVEGSFLAQQFDSVAKLSGGDYQFVIKGPRALVAVIDFHFEAEEEKNYILNGTLTCAGEFGLFPGIKVNEIKQA